MFDHIPLTLAQEDVTPAVGDGPAPGGNPQQPATPGATGQPPAGPPPGQSPGPGFGNLFFFFGIIVLMFLLLTMGQRKEKKRREGMLAQLKKGDKVQTIGGILGTLMEVRETEVVIKVDENANTRIKFSRGSIQTVLSEDKE